MYKKIAYWYLSREAVPYWYILITDCMMVFLSGILAYAVNHGASHALQNFSPLCQTLAVYTICFMVGFRLFHTYSGIIRKSSVADLARLTLAMLLGVTLVMSGRVWLNADAYFLVIQFRTLLLQTLMAIFLMSTLRITAKVFYDIYFRHINTAGAYGLSHDALLDMEMKELLHREPIETDIEAVRRDMQGRCVMVTGAAGSIGSELSRLLASCSPSRLILIDQAETPLHDLRMTMQREWPGVRCFTIVTSICHSHRMESIFRRHRPEIIFHAAAYKHVPMMEDNPVESILNNVDGTRKLADLAVRYGVGKFVMVSTDKAVNPTNVMGCSKRICEIYCQSLARSHRDNPDGCQFITTRFGNVLGSNGSVIPIFREQIRRGGPVCVTHPDIIRYFMLIPEACQLVLEAATIGNGGEIFVFDMGEPVRIADLARRMIALSGRAGIAIRYTGLRPGEKLFEEVLNVEEEVLPTRHEKIKIARVREYDFNEISSAVDRLIATACTYDDAATRRLMHSIVPEYRPPIVAVADEETTMEGVGHIAPVAV